MPPAQRRLLVAALAEKLAVTVFGHPAGAGEMAVVNTSSALWLGGGVDSEDYRDGFAPVGAIGRRVEDAHVFLHMRAIIVGQFRAIRW